jgi:hypothetical protein
VPHDSAHVGTPTTPSTRSATRVRVERAVARLSERQLLLAVAIVALVVRLPWIVGPVKGTIAPDSGVYLGTAHDLLHGHGFRTGGEIRTPAYPLLLAVLSPLPGPTATAAVVVQHLLGVAVTVALVWAAWRYFGRGAAVITGIVAALSPVLVDQEGDVLADFVFGVCVVAGALLLARALEPDEPALRWIAGAGAAFGVAALVKPTGQALLLAALVPLLVHLRRPLLGLRAGAVLAGCLVLTISPWLIRNVVHYGDARLSIQDGPALWLRVFDWDQRPIPTDTADGRLAKRLYDLTVTRSPVTTPTNTYQFVYAELKHRYGYTDREAMGLQRRVALEAIRRAPRSYAHGTWSIGRRLLWFTHELYPARFGINEKVAAAEPVLPKTPSFKAFSLDQKLVRAWWIASLALDLRRASSVHRDEASACRRGLAGRPLVRRHARDGADHVAGSALRGSRRPAALDPRLGRGGARSRRHLRPPRARPPWRSPRMRISRHPGRGS